MTAHLQMQKSTPVRAREEKSGSSISRSSSRDSPGRGPRNVNLTNGEKLEPHPKPTKKTAPVKAENKVYIISSVRVVNSTSSQHYPKTPATHHQALFVGLDPHVAYAGQLLVDRDVIHKNEFAHPS